MPDRLLRYGRGLCPDEERKSVEKELEQSQDLRLQLQRLRKVMALQHDIEEIESVDVNAAYQRTNKQIQKTKLRHLVRYVTRVAAVLTIPLLCVSALLGYLLMHDNSTEVKYAEVNSAPGVVVRYELPDGSVAWLNGGTKLRYPVVFNRDRREVQLSGEAYFSVKSDKDHPFYVKTSGGVTVRVTGTKFDVNAYPDENFIETVLEKGKVSMYTPGNGETDLTPGMLCRYDIKNKKTTLAMADVDEKISWIDGKLIFRNASLADVLKRLSRHFNTYIQFNNRTGKVYRYRATFRDETLTQILDYLARTARIEWRTETAVKNSDDTLSKERIIVNLYK